MQTKMFLLTTLFVFSIFPVTYAAIPIPSDIIDGAVLDSYDLVDEIETTLYSWQESESTYQALDLEMNIVGSPMELPKEPIMYKNYEGDNLYRIALNHNISLEMLIKMNGLSGDLIHPGDELIIGGDEDTMYKMASDPDTVATVFTPTVPTPPIRERKFDTNGLYSLLQRVFRDDCLRD